MKNHFICNIIFFFFFDIIFNMFRYHEKKNCIMVVKFYSPFNTKYRNLIKIILKSKIEESKI